MDDFDEEWFEDYVSDRGLEDIDDYYDFVDNLVDDGFELWGDSLYD